MSELIDFTASVEPLLAIVLRHCIHQLDMYFFKGMPKTYICNLQELAQELLTLGRFNEILYEKNRRPGESDPMRVQNIVNYQLANRVSDEMSVTILYDTADWKITFGMINGNPQSIRIIDGGHRFTASLEIEKILSTIQILDFQSEEEMFEKFRIINVSSDLPEIYRLSPDDLYKRLTEMLMMELRDAGWFVANNYHLNTSCGGGCNMPYLVGGEFSNFILKHKTDLFGQYIDFQGSIDNVVGKAIDMLQTINDNVIDQILNQQARSGKFAKYTEFYATNITKCLGYNASQGKRCINKSKTSPGYCGVPHANKTKYSIPTFDAIVEEIKKSGCAIGLLRESEIISKLDFLSQTSLI